MSLRLHHYFRVVPEPILQLQRLQHHTNCTNIFAENAETWTLEYTHLALYETIGHLRMTSASQHLLEPARNLSICVWALGAGHSQFSEKCNSHFSEAGGVFSFAVIIALMALLMQHVLHPTVGDKRTWNIVWKHPPLKHLLTETQFCLPWNRHLLRGSSCSHHFQCGVDQTIGSHRTNIGFTWLVVAGCSSVEPLESATQLESRRIRKSFWWNQENHLFGENWLSV